MTADSARPPCWRFGNVVVDTALHRVLVGGVPQELEPKSFRLLQFLIEHRERVVTKQEIFAAVWTGTVVSDNALTRAIAQIRKGLGDDRKQPRYIETVPTVGYRFIAEVQAPAASTTPANRDRGFRVAASSSVERDQVESWMTGGGAAPELAGGESTAPRRSGHEPSIAVLPFANLSADKENEYFADGLAEEILNSLAQIPDLKVIARSSSFAFRGQDQDITAIAAALRVHHVLEGSVRRAGTRIRVTAQLIAAGDGSHVWSERYDRGVTDVFAIQDEISEAIATALRVRLAPPVRTANLEAYQLHLKGRHHLLRLSREGLARARACFDQALAIDPGYAPAHSALAEHHHTVYILGLEPADTEVPLARAAAEKALTIDPDHGESHSILASLADTVDYEWAVAETLHRRALSAGPVASIVWFRYATWHLLPLGRVEEAEAQFRTGLATDPLNMPLQHGVAQCHLATGRYRQAIEHAHDMLELDHTSHANWLNLGLAQFRNGDVGAAVGSFTRVVELAPWWTFGIGWLAASFHLAGDPGRGEALARSLPLCRDAAIYHAAAGNADEMFEALDVAWRRRDAFLPQIAHDAVFDAHVRDQRFQSLLARMNLPGVRSS